MYLLIIYRFLFYFITNYIFINVDFRKTLFSFEQMYASLSIQKQK